jgi:hypothetical protein
MNKCLFLLKSLTLSVCFAASTIAWAANDFTTCPSPEMLKKTFTFDGINFDADLTFTNIISFDIHNNTMKFLVTKKNWIKSGSLNFVMSNITISAGQDPEAIAYSLISTLQSENPTPISIRIDDEITVPVCSYSSSDNGEVKATVFTGTDKHPSLGKSLK